jgi:arylsulfatase A-like enzyme
LQQRHETWWAHWASLTAAAALAATLLDALLLQRRRDFFTGGFLSVDGATSLSQAIAFLTASLLTDVTVLGIAAALLLWVAGTLRLPRTLALTAAFFCVLLPVAAADFVQYQLLSYLGDAFDLGLMFDLAGRDPNEMIAVASVQLADLVRAALAAIVAASLIVWTLKRSRSQEAALPTSIRRVLTVSIALLAMGAIATAALRASSDMLDNGLRRKPTGQLLEAVVRAVSDVDRDGFGILGWPSDPDVMGPRVYPYAVDIPGNGVDEDGVAGDLPVYVDGYREQSSVGARWGWKPDIVLVVLESFRADAFGATLAGKPVTPVLDALAAHGITAKHAYSHNGYTVQSRRHIFSGSVPDLAGSSTLLDDFKLNGYETAYFSAQDESFGGPQGGVGFERADVSYDARRDPDSRYSTFTTAGSLAVPYNVLTDRIVAFLKTRTNDRPLFLYVNFHDTHFPYHHARIRPLLTRSVLERADIVPERADALRATYLNTASNVDAAIGEVLAQVRASLTREPGIIVLGDHGESLFDEGFLGHGYALNDAQTRIPLIVANVPMTVEEPFGQADLRHAIASALGSDPTTNAPQLKQDPSRKVFQYLGTFDRPRQIALTGVDGRVLYDFRTGLARIGRGTWRRPENLSAAEQAEFVQLAHTWERMVLARNAARSEKQ